ncbi:MAG TPA: HEAT repeat domain-containing protein [Syntrophomonadaceae bacterium]|nr:HEAT repeat domain-containing protein [Syntrophomonadaceae bacterium]
MPDYDELLQGLQSDDERDRAFAVEDIVYEGIPEGLDLLIHHLVQEKSRFVREVIVNNLPQMERPDLVAKLLPLLRSDDAFIRNSVIDIVSQKRDEVVAYLEPLMEDADKDVRKFALDILFQLKTTEVTPYMINFLHDSDINIIITAVEYIGQLEDKTAGDAINQVLLEAQNLLLRCTCLESLAKIGNAQSPEIVARMFPDPDSIKGLELFSYLKFVAKQGDASTLPFVLSLMKSKGRLLAKEIINTLEGILERGAQANLAEEMVGEILTFIGSDINAINKYELLGFLGQFHNSAIFEPLVQYTRDPDKLVALGAIEGLGLMGRIEALPILKDLQQSAEDEDMLDAIQKSLQQLEQIR